MMNLFRLFAASVTILAATIDIAASSFSGRFRCVPVPSGAAGSVFSILQDPQGFVWLGTDDGLVRYDGYDSRIYRWSLSDSLSIINNVVNVLVYDHDKDLMYAGTDRGVSIYAPVSDTFSDMKGLEDKHVKSFLLDDGNLYVGTTAGLFCVTPEGTKCLYDGHVACVRKVGDDIYAGSYDCLIRLTGEAGTQKHELGSVLSGNNVLVLDICADPSGKPSLLLGTECGLVSYDPDSGLSEGTDFPNIPVKTFLYTSDGLWAGSDSGLILMGEQGDKSVFRHKVSDSSSLPNNVVWCIFEDKDGSIWLGTDHGVAIADVSGIYRYAGIDSITGSSDGLDVRVMASDGKGRLWLGGRDGLVCCDPELKSGFRLQSDAGPDLSRLSHNKVRALYDDGERMWIASDGGLDMFSHATGRVRHCHITEPEGRYSSNWMYCIAEDEDGMLWLGTYDGGVFGVRKEKVLDARGNVVCDVHLSSTSCPALSSDIIRSLIVRDRRLYVNTGEAVDIVDIDDFDMESVSLPDGGYAVSMMSGGDGIWVGADDGLYIMRGDSLSRVGGGINASSLAFHDGRIYVAGGYQMATYMPSDEEWTIHPTGSLSVLSVLSSGTALYVGSADGVAEVFPETLLQEKAFPDVLLTDMWLNDEQVRTGRNICFEEELRLGHSQNSFTFAFSSFEYKEAKGPLVYRLKGFDDTWRQLPKDNNKAVFINIPSGEYVFEYGVAGAGAVPEDPSSVRVRIAKVWYATAVAYIIYMVLAAALVFAVFRHIRMRHQLQMEHIERKRAIDMADSKTEFLANISHEFKNPLSIILNSVSRMVTSESDALRTRELRIVSRNAEKIHLLLNQMVEFNENKKANLFMPSAVSIVELAEEVWGRFTQAFAEKNISARFVADDIGYIFMVDKVQMESVFQNLLSNALKFTPDGGSILMSVSVREQTADLLYVDIKVEDTGCGIGPEELPHIFNRYYMAPSGTEFNMGGSGLGLHIVKDVVDMHKGQVAVRSEVGKGSCFTVTLSTMKADSFVLKSAEDRGKWTLHSLSQVWQHKRRPIILFVEDNHDIRDLVVASLGKDYVFLMAGEGKAALDILRSEKVDLIITDIAMPGMDGLTLCKEVRGSLKTAFLPVIVLTGKNDKETQSRSYEYADEFISKPFDMDWLNDCIIRQLIKHEQYLEKMRQQKVIEPKVEEVESPDAVFLKTIMDIIDRHIGDSSFSSSELSAQSRWSDKQVYRKMKQLTGKSPVEFIRDVRLEKAAMYLSQGKLTVMEVMYKVGFTTASYFSRCFKEKYGITPSEMVRRQN